MASKLHISLHRARWRITAALGASILTAIILCGVATADPVIPVIAQATPTVTDDASSVAQTVTETSASPTASAQSEPVSAEPVSIAVIGAEGSSTATPAHSATAVPAPTHSTSVPLVGLTAAAAKDTARATLPKAADRAASLLNGAVDSSTIAHSAAAPIVGLTAAAAKDTVRAAVLKAAANPVATVLHGTAVTTLRSASSSIHQIAESVQTIANSTPSIQHVQPLAPQAALPIAASVPAFDTLLGPGHRPTIASGRVASLRSSSPMPLRKHLSSPPAAISFSSHEAAPLAISSTSTPTTHAHAPLPVSPPSVPAPGGSSAALAGSISSSSGGSLLFILTALLMVGSPWARRRLRILSDALRPAPFVLIPQRPG